MPLELMGMRAHVLVKLLTRMNNKRPDLFAAVLNALNEFKKWEDDTRAQSEQLSDTNEPRQG